MLKFTFCNYESWVTSCPGQLWQGKNLMTILKAMWVLEEEMNEKLMYERDNEKCPKIPQIWWLLSLLVIEWITQQFDAMGTKMIILCMLFQWQGTVALSFRLVWSFLVTCICLWWIDTPVKTCCTSEWFCYLLSFFRLLHFLNCSWTCSHSFISLPANPFGTLAHRPGDVVVLLKCLFPLFFWAVLDWPGILQSSLVFLEVFWSSLGSSVPLPLGVGLIWLLHKA